MGHYIQGVSPEIFNPQSRAFVVTSQFRGSALLKETLFSNFD